MSRLLVSLYLLAHDYVEYILINMVVYKLQHRMFVGIATDAGLKTPKLHNICQRCDRIGEENLLRRVFLSPASQSC